jgi:cell division protein FtsW
VKRKDGERSRVRVRVSDRPDPWIVFTTLLLVLGGLLIVFDTSYFFSQKNFGDGYRMVTKHGVSIVMGGVLMWILSRWRSDSLEQWAKPMFLIAAAAVLLPFAPFIGHCSNGACRWVQVGPLNLQPAEFAKTTFVVYVAACLTRKSHQLRDWRYGLGPTLAVMAVLGVMLLLQPDFGTAALIGLLGFALMFLAGVPAYQLGLLGLGGLVAGGALVVFEPYRMRRFLCFLDPWEEPTGACYQLVQSYRTFGSGGLFGVGVGASMQKSGWLPEAHTDFVFSVIGEEIGLIGAVLVLVCFAVLAYRGFRIAHRHPERFGQILAAGITLAITLQALFNMGVVLGLLPTKGLVLPFLSYGGSSMMVSLACIGILMSLSRELRER